MSRWDKHPAAQAQTEEASKAGFHEPEEPVSSQLVMLGRNTVPHVFVDRDVKAWLTVTGRGVRLDISMSVAQLRSIQGQAERVLLAEDLKPVAS